MWTKFSILPAFNSDGVISLVTTKFESDIVVIVGYPVFMYLPLSNYMLTELVDAVVKSTTDSPLWEILLVLSSSFTSYRYILVWAVNEKLSHWFSYGICKGSLQSGTRKCQQLKLYRITNMYYKILFIISCFGLYN